MKKILDDLVPIVLPLLMFYFFSLKPLLKVRGARLWRETPCVIVSSSVNEDETDSGLHRIQVTYRYQLGGQEYCARRYSFSPASATAGRRGKRRAVRRLTPGTTAICYVNPDDHDDAVIERGVTWDMVFMGVMAIVFLGAFVFLFANGAVFHE